MTKIKASLAGLGCALAVLLTTGSAYAQLNDQSWVSSNGSGTACTRAAPCGSLEQAQSATKANGVISILDSGTYFAVAITKALTIRAEGVDGGMTTALPGGYWIAVQAGASDEVTLEGLHLNGGAILFQSGGHLHVVRCVIANNRTDGASSGYGIWFTPTGPSKLSVTDTVISNNGLGTGGGIVVKPSSGGTAQVALQRVAVNGNAFGIAADGSNSTGGINITVADSIINGNAQDGIVGTTNPGGAPIGLTIKNSRSINNAGFGVRTIGNGVTARLSSVTLTGNGTGVAAQSGGSIVTFGNNEIAGNGVNGSFTGTLALQ